jgi:hypothetical protein
MELLMTGPTVNPAGGILETGQSSPQLAGSNQAAVMAIAARLINAGAAFLTMVVITRYLSAKEQGFYYTFSSVLAIRIFVELGLSYVIMQSASHEAATLEFGSSLPVTGSPVHIARLGSLFRNAVLWYSVIISAIVAAVLPLGYIFFVTSHEAAAANWQGPWAFLVVSTSLHLAATPAMAVTEGCGFFADVARVRAREALVANAAFWVCLAGGMRLYAAGVLPAASLLVDLGYLFVRQRRLLGALWRAHAPNCTFSWRADIWPFQWRVGLSWLASYFVNQCYTPALFSARGSVEAGQMGLSLSAANAVFGISTCWVTSTAAVLGKLAAKKEFGKLDATFRSLGRRAVLTAILGACGAFGAVLFLQFCDLRLKARLVPPAAFSALVLGAIFATATYTKIAYLRSFKAEPTLKVNLVLAAFTAAAVFLVAGPFGALGLSLVYFCINGLLAFIAVGFVFRAARAGHEQHRDHVPGARDPALHFAVKPE